MILIFPNNVFGMKISHLLVIWAPTLGRILIYYSTSWKSKFWCSVSGMICFSSCWADVSWQLQSFSEKKVFCKPSVNSHTSYLCVHEFHEYSWTSIRLNSLQSLRSSLCLSLSPKLQSRFSRTFSSIKMFDFLSELSHIIKFCLLM